MLGTCVGVFVNTFGPVKSSVHKDRETRCQDHYNLAWLIRSFLHARNLPAIGRLRCGSSKALQSLCEGKQLEGTEIYGIYNDYFVAMLQQTQF